MICWTLTRMVRSRLRLRHSADGLMDTASEDGRVFACKGLRLIDRVASELAVSIPLAAARAGRVAGFVFARLHEGDFGAAFREAVPGVIGVDFVSVVGRRAAVAACRQSCGVPHGDRAHVDRQGAARFGTPARRPPRQDHAAAGLNASPARRAAKRQQHRPQPIGQRGGTVAGAVHVNVDEVTLRRRDIRVAPE